MKQLAKRIAQSIAILAISPLLLSHLLFSRLGGTDPSLETHSQLLSLIPGTIGSYVRVAFFRFTLQHCDVTATISFGTLVSKSSASIGKHVYIGPGCMLGCVTLEEDVLLGPAVQIPSGPHTHGTERLDTPIRLQPGDQRRMTVGRDCWIGAGSIVLADVAEQCVIGAASVVTKPTEPRWVYAGSPARAIKPRIVDEQPAPTRGAGVSEFATT